MPHSRRRSPRSCSNSHGPRTAAAAPCRNLETAGRSWPSPPTRAADKRQDGRPDGIGQSGPRLHDYGQLGVTLTRVHAHSTLLVQSTVWKVFGSVLFLFSRTVVRSGFCCVLSGFWRGSVILVFVVCHCLFWVSNPPASIPWRHRSYAASRETGSRRRAAFPCGQIMPGGVRG